MSSNRDRLDEAFQSLTSRSAAVSEIFSQQLEERLMAEQQKVRSHGQRKGRRVLVIAIALFVLCAGGGLVGYAAANGWTLWPWSVSIDEEGIVRDPSGNVIGASTQNEDGTSTAIIQMGQGHIEVTSPESLNGKSLNFVVEP